LHKLPYKIILFDNVFFPRVNNYTFVNSLYIWTDVMMLDGVLCIDLLKLNIK